jgi:hypothetical protein
VKLWGSEQLLKLVRKQARRINELLGELERLNAQNRRRRKKKRGQPAPPKDAPAPPAYRKPPTDAEITRRVNVPVTDDVCPQCGGELGETTLEDAYCTDIPKVPEPTVTHYRVQVRTCCKCRRRVRGRHPDVALDQHGATAHRVGDRAMAAAHWLHFDAGVPQRKVPVILQELTGIEVTQGALAQDAEKRAEQLEADYQETKEELRHSEVVNTDDTGWRVQGEKAQLMVFADERRTLYQIRRQHTNEEVRQVIPETYEGVLGTDRGKSYDAKPLLGVKQQKCQFHLLSNVHEVLDEKEGAARNFGQDLKELSQQGIALWNQYKDGTLSLESYLEHGQELLGRIDAHLRPRQLGDADNQRLLDGLRPHHERGNLFRFLTDPRIAPTNNLAERELRPQVIARKVSGGSKNWAGASTRERLVTITRTEHRMNPRGAVEAIYQRFRAARLRKQGQPSQPTA